MASPTTFADWEAQVPDALKKDPLWHMAAYRLSFIAEKGAMDTSVIARTPEYLEVAQQLSRAAGSVGANVAEGYSRGAGRDRVRFFEYALGSAREAIHWYTMIARQLPDPEDVDGRIDILTQIRRLLLAIIPDERKRAITRTTDD